MEKAKSALSDLKLTCDTNEVKDTTYGNGATKRTLAYEVMDGSERVTFILQECKQPSVRIDGLRTPSKTHTFVNTVKSQEYFSALIDGKVVDDSAEARELFKKLTGVELPKKRVKIVKDKALLDETSPKYLFS